MTAPSVATSTTTTARPAGELASLVKLAIPLIISQLGAQLMSFVDSIIIGRLGAVPLAAIGIGNSTFFSVSVVGIGCLLGMDPLIAQATGAGAYRHARHILDDGIRLALLISLPLIGLVLLAPVVSRQAGVDARTAHEVGRYLYARAPGTAMLLVVTAQRSYLQARQRPQAIVVGMILGNVVNLAANLLLVFGDQTLVNIGLPRLGLPALGIVGSGLSSTIAMLVVAVVLRQAIGHLDASDRLQPAAIDAAAGDAPAAGATSRRILRIGVPLGLQLAAEVGIFAVASMLAGRISVLAAAAHNVAVTLASCTFTVTVGIGAATAVRVGWHIGRQDTSAARLAGLTGLLTSSVFMTVAALGFVFLPATLARIVTDDPATVHAALKLLAIAAVFQLSDGTQAVAAGALRGAGDTRASLVANLIGHWLVGLPIAILLGLTLGLGAPGIWWGLSAGLTVVAASLVLRFLYICRRPLGRA